MKAYEEFNLYETLKEAYGASTQNHNAFAEAINAVEWDYTYEADGEIYFDKDRFTLTVESLDPFKEAWKPTAFFSDNSVIMF